ncbi:MAG: hypothetical protein IH921_03360 [Gemmatimonadetes bacterium]|nr:hypothetical protein [Gemmatimonadota bacterium]
MKTSILIATAVFCGLINAQSIQAQSGQELFQQALVMELSNGQVAARSRCTSGSSWSSPPIDLSWPRR